jgi:monoamine oxidase
MPPSPTLGHRPVPGQLATLAARPDGERILIVGAGLAGLTAATELEQ